MVKQKQKKQKKKKLKKRQIIMHKKRTKLFDQQK